MSEHTIADNLQRLVNARTAIANAITRRGGIVTAGEGFEDFPADIATIPNMAIYGIHIDPNESDPSARVTYLENAVGMTPVYMGETKFNYGSWEKAFFMPKPCVLSYNGTVAYYLDPNDYTKKLDGTSEIWIDGYGISAHVDPNFNWNEFSTTIWFCYTKNQKTYNSQMHISDNGLNIFKHEKLIYEYPLYEGFQLSENEEVHKLQDLLNAVKYLPQEEIKKLAPNADAYLIDFKSDLSPNNEDYVITYNKDGVTKSDKSKIHLTIWPMQRDKQHNNGYISYGQNLIHAYYGE